MNAEYTSPDYDAVNTILSATILVEEYDGDTEVEKPTTPFPSKSLHPLPSSRSKA
ncbi:hypothetical protein L905_25820 [Agrobacterium sp. TS43]|nr:hypothetical protein L902_11055 [Agrobacterium radiobacter DSM 30147]KVK43448.1 hypothetical protein L904_27390 [Agrobacterium sp. LY4]KVK43457.1 hypothetical protein L903_27415 [Agrobacterium sp. JL28]KVK55803.1 hypothetical protein L905_25820 [Agrobacterium sp. TS43]KVK57511.1 hypothetical protein L906_27325 [Agrobacterium sp. TS45]KVK60225.1 hypothetical protein L907_27270 [Agrobacterium sp. C13]